MKDGLVHVLVRGRVILQVASEQDVLEDGRLKP